MAAPPEPTSEQCATRAEVAPVEGLRAFACWYPQMGGYVGKCVVVLVPAQTPNGPSFCFDAWVWHDGEFAFGDGEAPVCLHHCEPVQFIRFGETVLGMMERPVADQLTTGGGQEVVSVGHNERGVFVYFHGDRRTSYSWHMSALEARALGGALVVEALDVPDGDLDRQMREAPADG